MTTLFISDLHLCDQQPHITKSFLNFSQTKARHARALYILGDFFEYWLGDDALDRTAEVVQRELKQLKASGTAIYFMAGNRDFLLGQQFADSSGMTLIEEPHVIELLNTKVLLVHGDAECTDDLPYQKVRNMFRNPDWQKAFLCQSIEKRIEFAQNARKQSQQHTQNTETAIMDVNQSAIDSLFEKHQLATIIHGHTHRPAVHQNGQYKRIVLGDWHHQTSYLSVDKAGFQLFCQ